MYAIQYFNISNRKYMIDIYPTVESADKGYKKLRRSKNVQEIFPKVKILSSTSPLNETSMFIIGLED